MEKSDNIVFFFLRGALLETLSHLWGEWLGRKWSCGPVVFLQCCGAQVLLLVSQQIESEIGRRVARCDAIDLSCNGHVPGTRAQNEFAT